MKIKKTLGFLTALFLAACASKPQLQVPQTLQHNQKTYDLASRQDLDSVARYFYVLPGEQASKWQSAVEILLDRGEQHRTLEERAEWRKKVYGNTGVKYFKLDVKDDALYSYVIYEPSAQSKDWQVNVAKGKNVAHCGFVQYQYSMKIPRTHKLRNMSNKKIISHLKKFFVDKEMKKLMQVDWALGCRR
ncbi:hypothetical protein HYE53_10960 [Aggregatibacter actinomycetemcomitans]|uniref:hypothetical protein n=1 Tax=Aggregatibacter actinomycetemcomitans TaxID=714 RepID=UPI00197BFEC3|nr:hypothetical protein [Aggregatibacter actinomycetemcomitans]MBN6071572.1 hypothetical protein [Aggregatibacter actinomycetemcomitans]